MSRWIDVDALNDSIVEKWGLDPKYFDDSLDAMKDVQTLEWINSAPSIDLVRCGECKWGVEDDYKMKCWNIKGLNKTDGIVNPDDFCSYGQRKK